MRHRLSRSRRAAVLATFATAGLLAAAGPASAAPDSCSPQPLVHTIVAGQDFATELVGPVFTPPLLTPTR